MIVKKYCCFLNRYLVGGALWLGDLIASAIKRDTGIKDFGWIFPGHSGFMDRFDSVMFIAPIMYILPMVIFGVMRECQINWRKRQMEFEKRNSGIGVNEAQSVHRLLKLPANTRV